MSNTELLREVARAFWEEEYRLLAECDVDTDIGFAFKDEI